MSVNIPQTFISNATHINRAQKATAKKSAQQQPQAQPQRAPQSQQSSVPSFSLNLYQQVPQQQQQVVLMYQQQQQQLQQHTQNADVKKKLQHFTGVPFTQSQAASQNENTQESKSKKSGNDKSSQRPSAHQQANPFSIGFIGLEAVEANEYDQQEK